MVDQSPVQPEQDNSAEWDLDVSIVESGDAVEALLCSTDNGCNTVAGGDC